MTRERRSVSMIEALYEVVSKKCLRDGDTMSGYIQALVLKDLGMTADDLERMRPPAKVKSMTSFRDELRRRREEKEKQMACPKVQVAKAMVRSPEEAVERAMANPCRLADCRRDGVHEAHDDQPKLYNVNGRTA